VSPMRWSQSAVRRYCRKTRLGTCILASHVICRFGQGLSMLVLLITRGKYKYLNSNVFTLHQSCLS